MQVAIFSISYTIVDLMQEFRAIHPPLYDYEIRGKHLTESRLLKGEEDVFVLQDTLFQPGRTEAVVRIDPKCIPPFTTITAAALSEMRISMRSRYAQLGLDVDEHIVHAISRIQTLRPDFFHEGGMRESLALTIPVMNWARRPVMLSEGSRLFRFFYWNPAKNRVRGKALGELLDRGDMQIHGEYGTDWLFQYRHPYTRKSDDIIGVFVRLDEEKLWIPEDMSTITISDNGPVDYRDEIANYLSPVPKTEEELFYLGRTKPVISLRVGTDAILSRNAWAGKAHPLITRPSTASQTNSPLIDGGTDWQVIVEIVGKTTDSHVPSWVSLQIAQGIPDAL